MGGSQTRLARKTARNVRVGSPWCIISGNTHSRVLDPVHPLARCHGSRVRYSGPDHLPRCKSVIFWIWLGLPAWPEHPPAWSGRCQNGRYFGFLGLLQAYIWARKGCSKRVSWCRTVVTYEQSWSKYSIFRSTLVRCRSISLGTLSGVKKDTISGAERRVLRQFLPDFDTF